MGVSELRSDQAAGEPRTARSQALLAPTPQVGIDKPAPVDRATASADHSRMWTPEFIIAVVTSGATVVAAGAAAIGALMARGAAKAAMASVEKAKLARRSEIAPRMVLEKTFASIRIVDGEGTDDAGNAVFGKPLYDVDERNADPTFELTNHGGGVALEVMVVLELEDRNPPLEESDALRSRGIRVGEELSRVTRIPIRLLHYDGPAPGSCIVLMSRQKRYYPSCGSDQTHQFDLSKTMLNCVFARGLGMTVFDYAEVTAHTQTLRASICCKSAEGDRHETAFLFEVHPVSVSGAALLEVNVSVHAIPLDDEDTTPRGRRVPTGALPA